MIQLEQTGEIKYLAVGMPKQMKVGTGGEMLTGIQKQQVDEAYLYRNGFVSDDAADKKNHGGPDRAVCLYPSAHYSTWEREFHTHLDRSAFGENITVKHLTEERVCLGDVYQLGRAVIQVTQGRIPCDTINKRTGIPGLMTRLVETGYTGFLCRVLEEGNVRAEDGMKLLERERVRISVLYANYTYFHDPANRAALEHILQVRPLADHWRSKLEKRLQKLS